MIDLSIFKVSIVIPLIFVSNPAQAAINILVSFTVVDKEVSPEQRVHSDRHTAAYTLEGHSVSMRSDTIPDNEGMIGAGHLAHKTDGTSFVFEVKIRSKHLVLTEMYSTEIITTIVDTNGTNGCTATRKDVLNGKQQFYQYIRSSDRQRVISTDRRYEDVTCVISE